MTCSNFAKTSKTKKFKRHFKKKFDFNYQNNETKPVEMNEYEDVHKCNT